MCPIKKHRRARQSEIRQPDGELFAAARNMPCASPRASLRRRRRGFGAAGSRFTSLRAASFHDFRAAGALAEAVGAALRCSGSSGAAAASGCSAASGAVGVSAMIAGAGDADGGRDGIPMELAISLLLALPSPPCFSGTGGTAEGCTVSAPFRISSGGFSACCVFA